MAGKPGVEFKPSLEVVARALRIRARDLTDLTKPNARIAAFLDTWVQRNFESEGGNVGGWEPFAAGGRWIPGVGLDESAKLLQDTGAMRASFSSFYDDEEVGVGSDMDRSQWHDQGTPTIPSRRLLPEREEVIEPILDIYNAFIEEVAEKKLW